MSGSRGRDDDVWHGACLAARMPLAAAAVLALACAAQGTDPAGDPWTRSDPAALARAGIAALHRFAWTDDHGTSDIQSLLGFEPLRCVETAHFKIASTLTAMRAPVDGDARARLRAELCELRARLPAVDPEARSLDPWLRTHLYAQRLERLYAEFARRFGVTEAAMAACQPGSAAEPGYAGEGPYLGQRGKFLVVLARSGATVGAYARNFLDLPAPRTTSRHHLARAGSLLLLTAEQLPDEDLREDAALHAAVAYHAAHMLLDGYRHYWHDCPPWFEEGVAHWFRVAAEPGQACFGRLPAEHPSKPGSVDWRANVRARLAQGNVVPAAELFRLRNEALRFEHHLAAFSRIDFLLAAHASGFPLFARRLKGPDPSAVPAIPSAAAIDARQADALARVFGWTPAEFDARWAAWVADAYPRI